MGRGLCKPQGDATNERSVGSWGNFGKATIFSKKKKGEESPIGKKTLSPKKKNDGKKKKEGEKACHPSKRGGEKKGGDRKKKRARCFLRFGCGQKKIV